MTFWKPIALFAILAFVVSVDHPSAMAQANAADCHNQANITAALNALRNARGSLERAEHNKGGWRVKAIESANLAIRETERGCAFADSQ